MDIRFVAMETDVVADYRAERLDANGQAPEVHTAEVHGLPCRHCLGMVPVGREYLVLAHRPFAALNPYAEVGPIFLCKDACVRGGGTPDIPEFLDSPAYIVRGYGADDRIVYGTGGVVPTPDIPERARVLLSDPGIAYLHVRSASNNCFHCRIERAD